MREFISNFQIPAGLSATTLATSSGRDLQLVLSESPGPYEAMFVEATAITDSIGAVVVDYLRGSGTLIDVGANIGTIALPVAMSGSNTVAIEMMASNVMKLRASVLLNRLGNVRVIQAAASDQDKMVTYGGEEAWGNIGAGTKEAVAGTLDSLCALVELGEPGFINSPVFLKLDVETHEPQVMKGSADFIRAFRPHIIFESIDVDDGRGNVADLTKSIITEMGYSLFLMCPYNVIMRAEIEEIQVGLVSDYLAVPNEQCHNAAENFPNFFFRRLRDDEIIQWLIHDVETYDEHRVHVLKYLKNRFRETKPSSSYVPVLEALVSHENFAGKSEAELLLSASLSTIKT